MDIKVFVIFAVLLILCVTGHAESRRYWPFYRFRPYDETKPSAQDFRGRFNRFRPYDENKPSALHSMDEKLTEDISDEDAKNALGGRGRSRKSEDANGLPNIFKGRSRLSAMRGKDTLTKSRNVYKDNGNNIFGFLQKSGRISDENNPTTLDSMDKKLTKDISDEDVENALDVLQKAVQDYGRYYG